MPLLRLVHYAVVTLLLVLSPALASAATTELRVYLDTDHKAATGCTVGGMSGVEQVLFTEVTDTGTTASVTATFRQVCTVGQAFSFRTEDRS